MGGCPEDVLEWFEEMGLLRRMAALRKNASVAAADAVIVAEAVHFYYPKMVQLHSYVEQNNTPGRMSNWKHLNSKVLKPMRCDLSDDQILRFASRQSEREVVEYLRELRIRLPSFEPLYLAEYHVINDAASQQMSVARMMKAAPQRSGSIASDDSSVLTDYTYETSSVASSVASSAASPAPRRGAPPTATQPMGTNLYRQPSSSTVAGPGGPSRRPSMIQSNKLLEKRKGREEVARRASVLTHSDIEAQFQALSGKIRRETISIAAETDELDRKSQTLDAQMAALQKQNQQELTKIEKRLSVFRLEQLEAETGQSVAISDDINYSAMVDPSKSAFARQVSEALRETALESSSLDVARGLLQSTPQKKPDFPATQVAPAENKTNVPFGGSRQNTKVDGGLSRGHDSEGSYDEEGSSIYSEEDEESGSEYETDESDEPPPPPPPPRAVIEAPVSTLVARPSAPQGSSNRENGIAKAAMSLSEISDLPIPPATSPLKTAMSSTNDHLKHFNLQTHFVKEEENDESNENDSDEHAAFEALSAMRKASASMRISKIPQAGPSSPTVPESSTNPGISPSKPQLKPVAVSSAEPSHRRCFDKKKQRFYYVDLVSGESKWRAPSEGIVLCTDKDNREYYFDVVTEKSTWVKKS